MPPVRNPYTTTNSFLIIEEPVIKETPSGLPIYTIKGREPCRGRKTPSYIYKAIQEARNALQDKK